MRIGVLAASSRTNPSAIPVVTAYAARAFPEVELGCQRFRSLEVGSDTRHRRPPIAYDAGQRVQKIEHAFPPIDPAVVENFMLGALAELPRPRVRKGLRTEEVALAMFLERMSEMTVAH